jgi:hypothetical protein
MMNRNEDIRRTVIRSNGAKIGGKHGVSMQESGKTIQCALEKNMDSCIRAEKLAIWEALNPKDKAVARKSVHGKRKTLTAQEKRQLWRITTNISVTRMEEIDSYIKNAERGRLPMSHDGANVTRPITEEQIAKFLECVDCTRKPVVFIQLKKRVVGVCAKHWIGLSDTVVGWVSGENKEALRDGS